MPNTAGNNSYYHQMPRGGGNGSISYQGQRYNNRNPNQNYNNPPMDANQMPPANMYPTSPTGTPSYVVNRSSGANAAATDPAMQSIINHKFFQPSAPPLTPPGPNACAYQYQPVSFPYHHPYGQMPYNQPQAVPE